MRFATLFIAALSAAAAQAAAVVSEDAAKRAADPWCLFHGEGCWKRDVAAPAPAAVAVREPSPVAEADPWCLFHGEGCWKRDAEPEAIADPEAWCLFHGEGCWKEKREPVPNALAAPLADPEADPWCLFHGEGCWKEKREAAPAPEADPEAWCLFHGEGCWKVKRAVYAFANAIRSVGAVKESRSGDISNMRGGAAYNAKRAVLDIAEMLAGRTSAPPEFLQELIILEKFAHDSNFTFDGPGNITTKREAEAEPWCLFHGEGCWKRSEDALQARDETADATRRWCLFHGEGCWKRDAAPWCLFHGEGCWKRDAEPMAKREAEADPWCLFHGEGCWKRTEEASTAVARRDAQPAFCPFEGSNTCYASKRDFILADKRACNQPGEACDIARRAAEALVGEIESWQPVQRSDDVEARWCLFHGEGCWKRDGMDEVVARCNSEDGACSQARRDLGAMRTAARNLLDYLKEE